MSDEPASTPDTEALAARVDALEAENARLRVAHASARGSRVRAVGSAVCITIAALLVPVAIVSAWARVQLVDEEAFVHTLAPLAEDVAVQDLVISQAMDAISAQVDVGDLATQVVDGIVELGVGPRAERALRLLERPAADALTGVIERSVTSVVRSDAFSDVWATATRGAHRALTLASTSDGGGVIVQTPDGLGIQLGPIVERVKARLIDEGVGVASLIPAVDRTVIVGSGDTLALVRTTYVLAVATGWWLPVVVITLFGLGIVLARRRSLAVQGTGIALALASATLGTTLAVGGAAVTMTASQLELSSSALDVIYQRLIASMNQTAWVLVVVGVLVATLGWMMGRSRAARASRSAVSTLNHTVREALQRRGVHTDAFGRLLARYRVLVRTLISLGAVMWLFALRPLGLGEVILVVVTSVCLAWVLELLQVRPAAPSESTPSPHSSPV